MSAHWSVAKLKVELIRRGASTSGRKTDLIERFRAYERNSNFQQEPVILPQALDIHWPVNGFTNIKEGHKILLPKITRQQTEAYFVYRLAGDHESAQDIKAIEKGKLLFEAERILACSILVQDNIYFSGIVGAAMKNKVTYNFKLKIEKSSGDPVGSHCECPAGKGPHGTCKHLAAVMIMLETFTDSGDLKVERSCTENLQMFNKPRTIHKGSPVKTSDLPQKRKSDSIFDDPRPKKYRNMEGYQDHVRNILINYTAQTSRDIAYRYLLEKANIQQAAVDHDYLKRPYLEYCVDRSIYVTQKDTDNIEASTRGQSSSKKWFTERSWRITASRFGEICKITSKRNISKLCASLSQVTSSLRHSNALLHGKNYEAKALKCFESQSGFKTTKSGFFICTTKPFLGATPDAIIDEENIVEIKCPYNGRNEKIVPGKFFNFLTYDKQGNVVLKCTSSYYFQIQGQLYVTKRQNCFFVVYTFCDLFVQTISIDEEYCNISLVPKLELFYNKYFRPYIASTL